MLRTISLVGTSPLIGLVGTVLLVAWTAVPVHAQESWEEYRVNAIRTAVPPTLDGILEEGVWERAERLENFVQQEPDEGAPSSERTVVYLLYDAENLYVGVRAWDTSARGVNATEMRRDSDRLLEEDNIQIILDTFKDSRSGYMFVTNPLGAQLDQQVFNEGEGARPGLPTSNINRDWDGVWHVASRIVDDGWIAEIAIPMVTLRFPDGRLQSWGMNVMRNIGSRNEQAFWAPISKEFTIARVSMAGSLEGMQELDRGMDLRVTPFVTSGASRVLESQNEVDNWDREVGVDLKYGITAGLNLDLTVNTDFAQAEVDDEQVNLTRFPLFFPEKRDFFLENSGQFNVGSALAFNRHVDLFFSRRIGLSSDGAVPIIGGARLTGKIGRNDIAVMDVQTDNALGESGENFLVAKYSRNLWGRSRVGGLLINKAETDGDYFNRTYAVDATLAPHPNFTVLGFVAKTETPRTTPLPADAEGYGEMGAYVNATWLDQSWRFYGEYVDLENDFNPEVGFLPRAGIRTTKLHVERNPRPDRWGIRVLSPMVNWTYTTDQTGRRVAQRWHYMLGTRFDNGAYLNIWLNDHFDRVDQDFSLNGVTVPSGDYSFAEWRFSFDSNPARRLYYGLMYSPQDFYGGTRDDVQLKLGARLTDRFSSEAQYTRNSVELPGGSFDVDLAALRIDLALSPTMTLRSVTQYNSLSDQFGTSARFRWTYRPGSDLYLVYDEVRRDPETLFEYRDRRIILKATYLLTR
ncbi:MAG: carbohydrate binding family 9 domain-containing protein [Gemmatimonadetes bacterium]|nr:carbohydrate binding family 9 domain-containing protein [Gemmatimonadota bacterium]